MVRQQDLDDANKDEHKLTKDDKGIKWERSCTDIICCIIFLAFIVVMVGLSGFALTKGDPRKILTPYDSVGNACGMPDQCSNSRHAFPQKTDGKGGDCPATYKYTANGNDEAVVKRDFTDYPYKYFPLTDPKEIFAAVCVKKCPETTYTAQKETGNCVLQDGNAGAVDVDFTWDKTISDLEKCGKKCLQEQNCVAFELVANTASSGTVTKECKLWNTQKTADKQAANIAAGSKANPAVQAVKGNGVAQTNGGAATNSDCYVKEVAKMEAVDFIPNDEVLGFGVNPSIAKPGTIPAIFPTQKQGYMCIPTKDVGEEIFKKMITEFDKTTGMVKYLVELGECWQILVGMAVATIFISIFYIFLLKWITKPLLYVSMLIILVAFVLLGGWLWMKKAEYDPIAQEQNYNYCLYGAIVAWVIGGIYLCFIICCWKNISLGASIMECASEFVAGNMRVLWLPILSYVVCVPFIAYWVVTAVFLYSIGQPEFNDGSPFANIKWEDNTRYMMWFFLFGLLWCVAFIICVQQFMIAATVCQWYFSGQGEEMADCPYTTSVWRSFKWGMWWHCGSIAFGSFIIALITFIRIIFEYIIYQYEQVGNKENPVYKCLKCYIRYVLWCLDKYCKFITKNAFIQVALQSKNFCSSAWTSFWLIIRHAGRFSSAAMIGWIMMLLGKGTIMGASCYLTFLVIKEAAPEVQQPLLPAGIILLVSYMVGSMFLSVFSFACTALLHCFILDEDTGGSDLTPKSLQGFLDMNDAKVEKEKKFKKIEGTGSEANKANSMS